MIFAEMNYPGTYDEFHDELGAFLGRHFPDVQSGIQSDSWFWIILEGGEKVAVDTFSSMKHQVKSERPGPHVQKVIEVLRQKYEVNVLDQAELEPHEDSGA